MLDYSTEKGNQYMDFAVLAYSLNAEMPPGVRLVVEYCCRQEAKSFD